MKALKISIRSGEAVDMSFGEITLAHRLDTWFNILAHLRPDNREHFTRHRRSNCWFTVVQ